MTQDSQVVMVSTTTHGCLYTVYDKDDTERKKIKYTGEISDEPKNCYCECIGWVIHEKCYHNDLAHKIMEVSLA